MKEGVDFCLIWISKVNYEMSLNCEIGICFFNILEELYLFVDSVRRYMILDLYFSF